MISRWAVSLAGCTVVRMRPREVLARETLRLGRRGCQSVFCLSYAAQLLVESPISPLLSADSSPGPPPLGPQVKSPPLLKGL